MGALLSYILPGLSEYHCDCKRLVTVEALCDPEPIIIAPDLYLLKESAEKQDACPFCVLCWKTLKQKFWQNVDGWAKRPGPPKPGEIPTKHVVKVTADFNFSTPVCMGDGRRIQGIEKERATETRHKIKFFMDEYYPFMDHLAESQIGVYVTSTIAGQATMSVFALPDTVGGLHIKERCSTIDADPDQNVWQTLASEWLRECGTHELCAQVEEDMELPTRVIDVASGVNPRLALSAGKRGKFMALSYCWGPQGDDLLVLNDATKTSLLEGRVEETAFARTHREAFAVARALGIQFVWIDALCIIQKNREDWEAESKRMAIVYNNAYLTVLAGSSTDSRAGFLAGRSSPAQPFPIPLDDSSRDRSPFLFATLKRSRTEGPTRTRSWCFQESMLSRRLLIFGPEQLMFKCITGDCFEHEEYKKMNGVHLTLEDQKTCLFHPNQQQLRLQPGSTSAVRYAVLEHWYIMLIEFTNRRLSNPDDIFASISSLAQTAALYLRKSRYLAGLWEEDIVRGLLWRPGSFGGWEPVELARPRSWMAPGPVVRAPTWSWAAVEGCIDHLDYEPGGGETMVMGGKSKSGGIPHGTRVRDSVFRTKPGFVRVRPAVRFSQGENDETFCWSEDMHCRPDVLHMPSCELRMWGRLVKADFSEQQVNLRRWEPSFDWRPEEQRYRSNAFNGSRYVFERALMIYAYGFYLVDGEDEGKKFAIGLFDVKEETCREVWCLQLTEIEGLMLREVQGDDGTRRYQRLGLFWLEQKSWFDNVDEVEVRLI